MHSGQDASYDISLYEYDLPERMIAQEPAEPRDTSRLMVLDRATGEVRHAVFRELGRFLRKGDLLVLNNTKVFPARTFGIRSSGGRVEVLFLRATGQGRWEVMVRSNGKPRPGEFLSLEQGALSVRLLERREGGHWLVSLPRGVELPGLLDEVGRVPLPPYIRRERDRSLEDVDRSRYQTVFARESGAVAAPTAGLHFTKELLQDLEVSGVGKAEITLHVGSATFQPIKTTDIRRHRMHEEFYSLDRSATEKIAATKEAGGRIVAVGTTACRTLEAVSLHPEGFGPRSGWTHLYIFPPFTFRMTDALLTNFHLPRSTLLVLAAAFAGRERILSAYEEAKRKDYRFYSYGDAMLIL